MKAASADTANTSSTPYGAWWWNATTAAELTSAPVGITGTSAPSATSTNNAG